MKGLVKILFTQKKSNQMQIKIRQFKTTEMYMQRHKQGNSEN